MSELAAPGKPDDRRVSILHVTESYGAGTATAVRQYARSTPEFDHYLLRSLRREGKAERAGDSPFVATWDLPKQGITALSRIRSIADELQPSVVHAHSSIAGVYVRLALRRGKGPRIVYTPHCFAFERRDVPAPARALYHVAERILARNQDYLAACSPREEQLAKSMCTISGVGFVPNVATVPEDLSSDSGSFHESIATIGRISPQKDPDFFRQIASEVRRRDSRFAIHWIGDGDAEDIAKLGYAGVTISGWLPQRDVIDVARRSSFYLHTALWEGFPLSVLEAVRLGLLPVVRSSPAFSHLPSDLLFSTVDEGVEMIRALTESEGRRREHLARWRVALADNTVANQHDALCAAYGVAMTEATDRG